MTRTMTIGRRQFLTASAGTVLTGAAGHQPAQPDQSKPNVLLIMTDQQRADAIGAYGNPVIRTPHLDALARGGTIFTRHFTQHPVCMPSRASIFTGRYPSTHRVRSNGVALPQSELTLAEFLRQHGYRTGGAGKFHFIPHLSNRLPLMETHPGPFYGFQEFHLGEDLRNGEHRLWLQREHPDQAAKPDHELPLELHNSSWVADHTVRFIRECAGMAQPFFAFASFVDPHQPYNPPSPYREMYREADLPNRSLKYILSTTGSHA